MEPLGAGTEIQKSDLDRGTRSFRGSTQRTWCLFRTHRKVGRATLTAQNSVASFYAYG